MAGQAGVTGSSNGVTTNAMFNYPRGIALGAASTFAVVVRRDVVYTNAGDMDRKTDGWGSHF